MKRKLSQKAVIALVALGLLLVAALGYFLLISPQRSKAAELDREIQEVQQQIATNRLAARRGAKAQPIRVADLFRLTKAMPDTADMPGVLLELNRIARGTGIRFESITPKDPAAQNGYVRLPIDLVFDGNFYELSDLLYRLRSLVGVRGGQLEATGRLFMVRALEFGESATHGFPQIKASLSVDAFVYGTGEATASPGGASAPAPSPDQAETPAAETDTPRPPDAPAPPGATAAGASR